jgi:hypothetical protein
MSSFVFTNFFKSGDHIHQLPAIRHGNEMESKVIERYTQLVQQSRSFKRTVSIDSNRTENQLSSFSGKLSPD